MLRKLAKIILNSLMMMMMKDLFKRQIIEHMKHSLLITVMLWHGFITVTTEQYIITIS